jgi:tight adherence protein B
VQLPVAPFVAGALLIGALVSLVARSVLPLGLALFGGLLLRARLVGARARNAEAAQRSAVLDLCAALRGELQAGRQPNAAFMEAVWCRAELNDLAQRFSLPEPDRDEAALLISAAGRPGREGLAALAACWRAAEQHGVPLVAAVSGIEDGLRAEQQRQQSLAAELSGVRATVALLAILPAFGLALGSALGTNPIRTLLTQPVGQACLLIGCLLELTGLRWTDRLVGAVDGRRDRARAQDGPCAVGELAAVAGRSS